MKKIILTLVLAPMLLAASCSRHHEIKKGEAAAGFERSGDRWGIKVESVRLSARGQIIDLRYRIVDGEKARRLTDKKIIPYLINESTGAVMTVPAFPMVGMMRQASSRPQEGRTYFILFANSVSKTQKGDKVTVVIGDFKSTGLKVE